MLNSPQFWRLIHSSRSRITVEFETDPHQPDPGRVRTVLAVPHLEYHLAVEDYAYYRKLPGDQIEVISKGSPTDSWDELGYGKGCLEFRDARWHDLTLLTVSLNTRLRGEKSIGGEAAYTLRRLRFSLRFTDHPDPQEAQYQVALQVSRRSGFADVLSHAVLNADSVPMFRRRPEIPFLDDSFHPQALGRLSRTGKAVRVLVGTEGWYEIPYAQMKTVHEDFDQWDLTRTRLWHQGKPVALQVVGSDSQGRATKETRLGFWGLASPSGNCRHRVYFLSEGTDPATPVLPCPGEATPAIVPPVTEAASSVPFELVQAPERVIEDEAHSLYQGQWFSARLTKDDVEETLPVPALAVAPQCATVSLSAQLLTNIGGSAVVQFLLAHDQLIGSATVTGRQEYPLQYQVPACWLQSEEPTLTIRIEGPLHHPEGGGVYLKRLVWNYQRQTRLQNGQLLLERRLLEPATDLLVESERSIRLYGRDSSGEVVWDLSDLIQPALETPSVAEPEDLDPTSARPFAKGGEGGLPSYRVRLSSPLLPASLTHLLLVEQGGAWSPNRLMSTAGARLHEATEPTDVLFLCHSELVDSVRPLADWRRQEGFAVRVVDLQDVYDEFAAGYYSAQAIRDFLIYTQIRWPAPIPQYVILVGDSTYDPKNNLQQTEFIHIPYATFRGPSSVVDPADEWFVRIHGSDGLSDLIIGRISVASVTDARVVVEKIITFESRPLLGPWRARVLSLTDNHFEDRTREILQQSFPEEFEGRQLEIRDYPLYTQQSFKARGTNTKWSSAAKLDIIAQLSRGTTMLSYVGHGGGSVLAHEAWFVGANRPDSDVLKLDNRRRLPFVSIYSCLTGLINYPRYPFNYCLSEEFLRRPDRGAIAVYGPSGYGGPQDHEVLARGLNPALSSRALERVGDAATLTEGLFYLLKDNAAINEQFNLFGDPLTRWKVPSRQGILRCSPARLDAWRGGRLLIEGEGLELAQGKGLLSFHCGSDERLIRTVPVRVSQGAFKAPLLWPPNGPTGTIIVRGYFWNPATGQDAVLKGTFQCEAPKFELRLRDINRALTKRGTAGEASVILSATLENKSSVRLPGVQVTLLHGSEPLEKQLVTLGPQEIRMLEFRLPPSAIGTPELLQLQARTTRSSPLAYSSPEDQPGILLAVVDDSQCQPPGDLLTVDLTGLPDGVPTGIRTPRVKLPAEPALGALQAVIQAEGQPGPRIASWDPQQSTGSWWSCTFPEGATPETKASSSRLVLRRSWASGAIYQSTWELPFYPLARCDVALTRLEITEASPVAGFSLFLNSEVQNLGDPIQDPGSLGMKTDRPGLLSNPLANNVNLSPPKLPPFLEAGQIVKTVYRWDPFDNEGPMRIEAAVPPKAERPDIQPSNNSLAVLTDAASHQSYSQNLMELVFEEGPLNFESLRRQYQHWLRQLGWIIAYENYDEAAAKPALLQRLAMFALGAEELPVARRVTRKLGSLNAQDPGNRYLEATVQLRHQQWQKGQEALQAVVRQGFLDSTEGLARDVKKDPMFHYAGRFERWDPSRAVQLWQHILRQQPANLEALKELSRLFIRRGETEAALECCQQVARLLNYDLSVLPPWWFEITGRVYSEMDQPRKALDIFQQGRKYHAQADFSLWESHARIDLGQSRAVLSELMEKDDPNRGLEEQVFAWYQIGRCYATLRDPGAAEAAFRKVLRLDPKHRPARQWLMQLRTKPGSPPSS